MARRKKKETHRGGTKKLLRKVGQRLGGHGGLKHTKRRKKPPALLGKPPKKGERKGQSKHWGAVGYIKGGKYHEYDPRRDRKIKAKHTRKRGEAPWRGDLPGSLI